MTEMNQEILDVMQQQQFQFTQQLQDQSPIKGQQIRQFQTPSQAKQKQNNDQNFLDQFDRSSVKDSPRHDNQSVYSNSYPYNNYEIYPHEFPHDPQEMAQYGQKNPGYRYKDQYRYNNPYVGPSYFASYNNNFNFQEQYYNNVADPKVLYPQENETPQNQDRKRKFKSQKTLSDTESLTKKLVSEEGSAEQSSKNSERVFGEREKDQIEPNNNKNEYQQNYNNNSSSDEKENIINHSNFQQQNNNSNNSNNLQGQKKILNKTSKLEKKNSSQVSKENDKKNTRRRKSEKQLKRLQQEYDKTRGQMTKEQLSLLAKETGLTESQVYKWVWDQNNNKKKEETLPSRPYPANYIQNPYFQQKERICCPPDIPCNHGAMPFIHQGKLPMPYYNPHHHPQFYRNPRYEYYDEQYQKSYYQNEPLQNTSSSQYNQEVENINTPKKYNNERESYGDVKKQLEFPPK